MERTLIKELRSHVGKEVKTQRLAAETCVTRKKMQFLVVRDHTGAVQVVFEKAANEELAATISTIDH